MNEKELFDYLKENKFPDLTKEELLKAFIDEFFDLETLIEIGFLKKEMASDYPAIAEKICTFFGFESIYEYGKDFSRAHLSFGSDHPMGKPSIDASKKFIQEFGGIYD